MSASAALRPFVGRDGPLAQIGQGTDDARAGRGRLFLVTGEPGIGKTRFCDEIAARAGGNGLPVIWGRSWEAGGAPAYWPWLEVLAALARGLDDAALAEAVGDGGSQLAELVPEIARRLDAGTRSAGPPDEARFRLWRAVAGLIRRSAAPTGLVLVFEDLHAADHSSLALIYFVARELRSMRVLMVATCRDVEARLDATAGELITRIGREGVTIGLPRLDRGAAEDLVRQRVGEVDPAIAARIFESTQGNPLFVEEMLRLLGEEGPDAIAWGVVPNGVRDVIRQRLDRVAADARGLLDLGAVIGDEPDLGLLASVSARPRESVARTLTEAVRVGVLVERGGRFRFAHALIREVLYRDLEPDARREAHGRVAASLERLHAGAEAPPLAALAYHALEGPAEGLPRAVRFAARAAERALDLLAHDEAIALLERAVAAVETAGNPPGLRAEVTLALGEARIRSGETTSGRSACCEAATLARSIGDGEIVARAALAYGRVFMFAVVDPILVGMLEEGLAALPPGDGPMRARLLARLGPALLPTPNTEEPLRVVREAIGVARRLGDRRVLLETLHDGLSALMDIVDPRERHPLNLETEQLATELGDRERLLRVHARLAIDHLALGEVAAADARIAAFASLAAELRASWQGWRAEQFRAVRALIEGRFADAERHIAEGWEAGRRANDPQVERAMTLQRETVLRVMERHDEMIAFDPQTRRERAVFHNGPIWQAIGSAMMYARLEDADKTRLHLDLLQNDMLPPVGNLFPLLQLVEPIALVGSDALARRMLELLAPISAQYAMLGMTQMMWEGPVTRLVALLEARLRRWDDSIAHFENAIARSRDLGARPFAARGEYELGRTLLARGLPADAERARRLFTSARGVAEEIGMPGLVRLAQARLDSLPDARVKSAVRDTASHPTGAPPAPGLSMALEGEYWSVGFGGATFRFKDSLGLQYLARLCAAPGREVHVLELAGGGAADGRDGEVVDGGDAGEMLDDEAREEYKRRLEDLRDTLAEAESFGDAARAGRAREEIEFLGAELGRAVGLGGRSRRAGAAAERARSAVQRRIKNALERLAEVSPELGLFLSGAVRTGNFCVFRPDGR